MTNAMKKNRIGKNADTAASAFTPSMWPTYTLLSVPDSDCRMFATMSGPRNATKVRHSGRAFAAGTGATGGCWSLAGVAASVARGPF